MLEILFQDERLVAIHKPAGMLVHNSKFSGRADVTCVSALRERLGRAAHPVHRLDRATSGVMLFAFTSEAVAETQALFRERLARKTYLAVVRGYVPEEGEIDKPLVKDPVEGSGILRDAVTHYRRLAQVDLPYPVSPNHPSARYSLVRAEPLTGRMHQIRRHFLSISHPLIGDTVYGDGRHNRFFRSHFGLHRLCLAAVEIRIPGYEPFRAPPAPELQTLFKRLDWTWTEASVA